MKVIIESGSIDEAIAAVIIELTIEIRNKVRIVLAIFPFLNIKAPRRKTETVCKVQLIRNHSPLAPSLNGAPSLTRSKSSHALNKEVSQCLSTRHTMLSLRR